MTDELIESGPKICKTTSGVEFIIKPVSQYAVTQLRMTRKVIPVPTYKVKLAGGDMEEVDFDATYVKDHADDPAIAEKWKAYIEEVNEDISKFNDRFGRMIILMGTEIDVPGVDSEWQKEQEYIGYTPPTAGPERKIYYMLQSVMTDDNDVNRLASEVLALGRVDMEKVRLARDSFQRDEGQETPGETDEETGELEGEPVIQ